MAAFTLDQSDAHEAADRRALTEARWDAQHVADRTPLPARSLAQCAAQGGTTPWLEAHRPTLAQVDALICQSPDFHGNEDAAYYLGAWIDTYRAELKARARRAAALEWRVVVRTEASAPTAADIDPDATLMARLTPDAAVITTPNPQMWKVDGWQVGPAVLAGPVASFAIAHHRHRHGGDEVKWCEVVTTSGTVLAESQDWQTHPCQSSNASAVAGILTRVLPWKEER